MIRDPVADWQELSALYEQSEGLDGQALQAWLSALPDASRRLRPQLERMIGARTRVVSEGFLEGMPALPKIVVRDAPVPVEWAEGSRVGPYRLVRHLGSGGMAEVWLAERADGAFDRTVAIKLLFNHPSRAERESFAERFRRERDILASLSHPNIASLHDAGVTPAGQPWLALEYVEGEPITTWCDRQRLTIAERIAVFRQVLLAIEHAHASLVIHRDLKPANILVTPAGEVKLLDFGIAKLMQAGEGELADSELTRQNGRPMTLRYASPEQFSGRPLTTASDQYSLGVLLYELLCGESPYELRSDTAGQIEAAVIAFEPRPPSRRMLGDGVASNRRTTRKSLTQLLAADLEAVPLKTLRKLPDERFASVEATRCDLDRWLGGRPLLARKPSAVYRARKFIGRHRLGVASVVGVFLVLLGMTAVSVVQRNLAQDESNRALASQNFLQSVMGQVDPEVAKGTTLSAIDMLRSATKRAVSDLGAQPLLRADVLAQIGKMQGALNDYRDAAQSLNLAASSYGEAGAVNKQRLALLDQVFVVNQLGDSPKAKALLESVSGSAATWPDDRRMLQRINYLRGIISLGLGDRQAARLYFKKSLEFLEGRTLLASVQTLSQLAVVDSSLGLHADALREIDEASHQAAISPEIGIRQKFGVESDKARIELSAGRYRSLSSDLPQLQHECDALLGPDSEDCGLTAQYLATVLLRRGSFAEARREVPRFVALGGNFGSPRRQIAGLGFAARILAANGAVSELRDVRDRLITLTTDTSQSPADLGSAMSSIAESYLYMGEAQQATPWARKSLTLQEHSSVPGVARARLLLALSLSSTSQLADARSAMDQALVNLSQVYGPSHPLFLLYSANDIVLMIRENRPADARLKFGRLIGPLEDSFGTDAPVIIRLKRLLDRQEPDARMLGLSENFI